MPAEADEHTINFMVNIEKYKKTPVHVKAMFENGPPRKANKKYLIFKRWDSLTENDNPQRQGLGQTRAAQFFNSLPQVSKHA